MRFRTVSIGPAPRSLAHRFRRPGLAGRVLMTATMLGVTIALSTVGVIAHVDQQATTKRLAMQRERNLQAIGISVAPSESNPRTNLAVASNAPERAAR